jgi:hypothetical protein
MVQFIEKFKATKANLRNKVIDLLVQKFSISKADAVENYRVSLLPHLNNLIDKVYFLVEYPYVDKVYRDSFYHYYSSKLYSYKRDCIRISIFNSPFLKNDFRTESGKEKLKQSYLGFFVIRPLTPSFLGRSAISPLAVKGSELLICKTKIGAAINSVKLTVNAFPHSSQDEETISCAETTLWAIMEYFGNKYPEYFPILPSKIHNVLAERTPQRQVPSMGLSPSDISYALKEFRFGPRIYSEVEFDQQFLSLLAIYVESGIPVIVLVENNNVAHAIICVGRERFKSSDLVTTFPEKFELIGSSDSFFLTMNSKIDRNFIFIDDNRPVYQRASLKSPCLHYSEADWKKCAISHFIVPLYSKINLEAFQAKNYLVLFMPIIWAQSRPKHLGKYSFK